MQQTTKNNKNNEQHRNVLPFIPDGDFYFSKGVAAFQKRRYDLALKWLQKAVEKAPDNALYKCQMAIIYTETGVYEESNKLLWDVLASSGDEYTDCYYLLANNHAHMGRLQDAKSYVLAYLDKEPDGDFQKESSRLLERIEMEEETDDDRMEEDELLVYQEAVFQHMENREWEQAIPLLEDMLKLFPEHHLAKHDYAQALFYSGEKEKAIQMELDILEEDPTVLYAHIHLAVFYFTIQSPEYKAHIQTILNVYPIYEEQKLRIAIALAKTEHYHDAYLRFRMLSKGKMKHYRSYYRWFSIAAYHVDAFAKAQSLKKEGGKLHPGLYNE